MGSSTIPASGGSSSAAPLFAGSLVTSGYSSQGWFQTSLPAGSYVMVQNNGLNETYGYKSSNNPTVAYKVPNGVSSYFTLASTDTTFTSYTNLGVYGQMYFSGLGSYVNWYTQSFISYANGYYFVGGGTNNNMYLYYATDGLNYTAQLANQTIYGATSPYVGSVNYQSGYYSVLTNNTSQNSPSFLFFSAVGGAVTYMNSYFTAPAGHGWTQAYYIGGSNNYVLSWSGSTNSTSYTWSAPISNLSGGSTRFAMTTNCGVNIVGYGGGAYVAGAQNGTLASSTDSITWATRTSGISHATNGNPCYVGFTSTPSYVIAWTYGRYYGSNYDYAYSTNGTTWTVANWPTVGSPYIPNVNYAPPVYCTNGIGITVYDYGISDNVYFVSTNGISWTTRLRGSTDSSQAYLSTNNTPYTPISQFVQGPVYTDPIACSSNNGNVSSVLPQGTYLYKSTPSYYSIYNTTSATIN